MAPTTHIAALALLAAAASAQNSTCTGNDSFYTAAHAALLLNGSIITWAGYEGSVLTLTNVASF